MELLASLILTHDKKLAEKNTTNRIYLNKNVKITL